MGFGKIFTNPLKEPEHSQQTASSNNQRLQVQAALTLPFPTTRVPYGTKIYLECRSLGPIITVDGSLTGREWGE